jgi:hypothetical protein
MSLSPVTDLGLDIASASSILDAVRSSTTTAPAFRGFMSQMAASSTQIIPSSQPSSQVLMPPPGLLHTQLASARFGTFGLPVSSQVSEGHSVVPATTPDRFPFSIPALDTLTGGGLPRGHILEISGAPNTPREIVGLEAARSALGFGEAVLWVDTQNMTKPYDFAGYFSSKPILLT